MKAIITLLLMMGLSGCVGMYVSETLVTSSSEIVKPEYGPVSNTFTGPVKESYGNKWCGVSLMVVAIPIPLMLPVCESYRETEYKNGEPIETTLVEIKEPLYACGPLMWLGPAFHGYEGNILCGKMYWVLF